VAIEKHFFWQVMRIPMQKYKKRRTFCILYPKAGMAPHKTGGCSPNHTRPELFLLYQ